VDNDPAGDGKPISVFESGAILQYLAEKTGKFLPADLRGRTEVMQWLFWQMGGLGPMLGQNHHFRNYSDEKLTYAINRYVKETERLYGVDERLADREFAPANTRLRIWRVILDRLHERQGQNLDDFPTSSAGSRQSSDSGSTTCLRVAKALTCAPGMTEEAKAILFGQGRRTKG
jgi:GST-like protein